MATGNKGNKAKGQMATGNKGNKAKGQLEVSNQNSYRLVIDNDENSSSQRQ